MEYSGLPFAHYCRLVTGSATTWHLLGQETFPMTLLDVIRAVREVAANDQETLATLVHLIRSGQVRLSEDAIKAMMDLLATADAAA
jgi:hypothetical protein